MAADIQFLTGEYVPHCTHDIDKHWEGYYTLQLMTAGRVELHVGAARYLLVAPPAQVWSAYPGPRIRFRAAAPAKSWTHRYIAFRGPLVGRWMEEGIYPVVPQAAAGVADVAARFDRMLALGARPDTRSAWRAGHLLEGLLLDIAEAREAGADPVVAAARARLEGWARESAHGVALDYGALARELGVSESTLRRRFARALGVAPHAYLIGARIGEARRLLGETDWPIKAVADRLGYADVYFFSRQFRRLTGVPPAAYRRGRLG